MEIWSKQRHKRTMLNYSEYVLLTIALTCIYMEVIISMQQSSSSEAHSSSASQEIPCLLLDPKVHHSVHTLSRVPIISQKNPIHTLPFYFFQIHFSIILPPMPRSSKCSFSHSGMPHDPLSTLLLLLLKLTYFPQHLVLLTPSVYVTGWNSELTISMCHQYFFIFQ